MASRYPIRNGKMYLIFRNFNLINFFKGLTLLTEHRRVLRQFFSHYFSTNLMTIDRLFYKYLKDFVPRGCRSIMSVLSILEKQLDFPRNMVTNCKKGLISLI